VDWFLLLIHGVLCSRTVMCHLYVALTLLPIWEGDGRSYLIKTAILVTWIGIFNLIYKILKLKYYQNLYIISHQILHNNKNYLIVLVNSLNVHTANLRWQMRDSCHFEKHQISVMVWLITNHHKIWHDYAFSCLNHISH